MVAPRVVRGGLCLAAGAAAFWALTILLTPWLATRVAAAPRYLAAAAYVGASAVCHQRADRSFHVGGVRLPVCARCTGLYLAAPVGLLLALRPRRAASRRFMAAGDEGSRRTTVRLILAVAAAPTALTLLAEWSGIWPAGNLVRALAAAPVSLAAAAAAAHAVLHDDSRIPSRPEVD